MKQFSIRNAVLYKDLQMDSKRPKLAVMTIIFCILTNIISLMALLALQIMGGGFNTIPQRFLLSYFQIFVLIQSGMVFMIVPAITAGCISIEKERQTMEVLLTTRMTPWQIIKGKYASAISMVVVLILACIPSLAIVQIYGGISMLRMLLVIFVLITSAMFIASIGVFYSALFKNTIISVILTYITVGILLFASIGVVIAIWGISAAVSSSLYYEGNISLPSEDYLSLEGSILLLYVNPIATIFDVLGQAFGFAIDDSYTINGMKSIMEELGDWSPKNFFTLFWTPISILIQMAITYGLLRAAGAFLNPLKSRRKHKKNVQAVKR